MRGRVLALSVCMFLIGCGSGIVKPDDPLRLASVTLRMAPQANENWPAKVEMVRVEDMNLLNDLIVMPASDWFGPAGAAFRNANPEAHYNYWELPPGSLLGPVDVRVRGRLAGVLFCDTRSPQSPLRVERHRHAEIAVGTDGCTVTGDRRGRSWLDAFFGMFSP